MSTVTLELETSGSRGDFAIMHEIKWRTGGSWLCTTKELAEHYANSNLDDAISITERHIIYK